MQTASLAEVLDGLRNRGTHVPVHIVVEIARQLCQLVAKGATSVSTSAVRLAPSGEVTLDAGTDEPPQVGIARCMHAMCSRTPGRGLTDPVSSFQRQYKPLDSVVRLALNGALPDIAALSRELEDTRNGLTLPAAIATLGGFLAPHWPTWQSEETAVSTRAVALAETATEVNRPTALDEDDEDAPTAIAPRPNFNDTSKAEDPQEAETVLARRPVFRDEPDLAATAIARPTPVELDGEDTDADDDDETVVARRRPVPAEYDRTVPSPGPDPQLLEQLNVAAERAQAAKEPQPPASPEAPVLSPRQTLTDPVSDLGAQALPAPWRVGTGHFSNEFREAALSPQSPAPEVEWSPVTEPMSAPVLEKLRDAKGRTIDIPTPVSPEAFAAPSAGEAKPRKRAVWVLLGALLLAAAAAVASFVLL